MSVGNSQYCPSRPVPSAGTKTTDVECVCMCVCTCVCVCVRVCVCALLCVSSTGHGDQHKHPRAFVPHTQMFSRFLAGPFHFFQSWSSGSQGRRASRLQNCLQNRLRYRGPPIPGVAVPPSLLGGTSPSPYLKQEPLPALVRVVAQTVPDDGRRQRHGAVGVRAAATTTETRVISGVRSEAHARYLLFYQN